MQISTWGTLFGGIVLLSSGCVKDRNLDDYITARRQEQNTRLTSIEGIYGGSIVRSDGVTFGITLELNSWSQVRNSDQVASLSGALSIGNDSDWVSFVDGNFDRNSNQISVRVPLAEPHIADLNAQFFDTDDGLEVGGKIRVRSELSTFFARRGAPAADSPKTATIPFSSTLDGFLVDDIHEPLPVRFSIFELLVTPEQKTLSRLSRRKSVSASISINGDFDLDFPNSELDAYTHSLYGVGINPFKGTRTRISCAPEDKTWVCLGDSAGRSGQTRFVFNEIP